MSGSTRKPAKMPRRKLVLCLFILALSALVFVGYPALMWYNKENPVSRECTIEFAEISNSRSGTGGLSTSSTKLKIHTEDCGTVYVDRVADPGFRGSWQKMADEVNKHQGQKMTLLFEPIQLPAEGDPVEGLGFVVPD